MYLLFLLLALGTGNLWALERKDLVEGEKQILMASGTAWVEDGEVIRLEPQGTQWQLKAIKPGKSEIQIGEKKFVVTVYSRSQQRSYETLKTAARSILNLQINKESGVTQVTGRLLRWQDWQALAEACKDNECNYEMRSSLSAGMQNLARSEIAKKLKSFSIFPYQLEFSDKAQIHLPPKIPQLSKIHSFLSRYGISVISDPTSLEMQPLIKVQITVAEVKRSEFYKYGIQWPDSYTAQILPASGATDPLTASLHALEASGMGKVLASPNLLCQSGKEAEFLAGGEFPIKILNFKIQDVVWKKYGILLRVKPLADFSGRMNISIETEISSIDPDRTVDGVPGLFTNRLQSHFNLSEPKTIALSGLLKKETGESSSGLPGLSRIPILGALFSSKDYRENRTELVIFVRPEIVSDEELK